MRNVSFRLRNVSFRLRNGGTVCSAREGDRRAGGRGLVRGYHSQRLLRGEPPLLATPERTSCVLRTVCSLHHPHTCQGAHAVQYTGPAVFRDSLGDPPFLSLKLTFLSLKLTFVSLELTFLILKLTLLSLKLTFLILHSSYRRINAVRYRACLTGNTTPSIPAVYP
jgi:hypothetical protein